MNTPTVGDWYAVSLDESGWAACYVGRVTSEGWMLGYFFGPWAGQPTSADVAGCTAEQAAFVLVVSPQAIETGDWPLISPAAGPPSELWPMPVFRRFQPVRGRHVEIELDEELRPARERWMDDPERVRSAVMYSLAGSGVPKIQAQRMMFPTPDWYPVEGEAFVTLKDGWYYPGRVARADLHNRRFLCYMFRRSTEPIDVTQVATLTVEDARAIAMLSLREFRPPLTRETALPEDWAPAEWPIPWFGAPFEGRPYRYTYAEGDLAQRVRIESCTDQEARSLPSGEFASLQATAARYEPAPVRRTRRMTTSRTDEP